MKKIFSLVLLFLSCLMGVSQEAELRPVKRQAFYFRGPAGGFIPATCKSAWVDSMMTYYKRNPVAAPEVEKSYWIGSKMGPYNPESEKETKYLYNYLVDFRIEFFRKLYSEIYHYPIEPQKKWFPGLTKQCIVGLYECGRVEDFIKEKIHVQQKAVMSANIPDYETPTWVYLIFTIGLLIVLLVIARRIPNTYKAYSFERPESDK